MGAYIDVTDESFQADVLDSDIPVLVDFWAPWCGPCRALTPHLEAIGKEFSGRITVAKVNVDENQKYATQFGVRGIPKMILFNGGAQVDEITGLPRNPKVKLSQFVEQAL
jgi:thioredoxin 1